MKSVLSITLSFLICLSVLGQNEADFKSGQAKFGFGIQMASFQSDYAFGLNLTSPTILKNLYIRANGNHCRTFVQLADTSNEFRTKYFNASLGIGLQSDIFKDLARIYIELGPLFVFPDEDFSDDDLLIGTYVRLGTEVAFSDGFFFFIDAGATYRNYPFNKETFVQDKTYNQKSYSTGFHLNTGLRYYLFK